MLWGAGLGGGYVLAYHGWGPWPAQHTPAAFWIASAAALAVTALAFALMLWRCLGRSGERQRQINGQNSL